MNLAVTCNRCRQAIPADAPHGSCPACMLMLGLMETPDDSRDLTVAVSVAAATVSASGFDSQDPDATITQGREGTSTPTDWPTIPGYRIVGELGEGGGGRVFQAEQQKAGRRLVAIKVLHGTSRGERERLAREARSLGLMSHPNVVSIHDVGETAEGPYFTMEFMPGGSLADRTRQNRLTPAESAKIVEAVSRGVAAAHSQGILHRDLKPSNVLLTADGVPKVSDFGLAKFEEVPGDASTMERITPTGALLGTPGYMAPEQAAGRTREVDERSDVYGIGAILYQCLTGRAPFSGETHVETAHRVIHEEVVPPRSLNGSIHPDLEAVCLKCLEKQKSARYESAVALAEDLARTLSGEGTIVRPAKWGRRMIRRIRRNRRAIATTSVVCLLLATVVIAVALARRPEDEKAKARKQLAKELAGDQPVTLIGEKGLPKWFEWKQGDVPFSESPFHDGSCSFATITESRLELVPMELMPSAYVLEAEILHKLASRDMPASVGLYFNDHVWEKGDDYQATARYILKLDDFVQPTQLRGKFPPPGPMISVHPRACLERPGRYDLSPANNAMVHLFQPARGAPDSWRKFRVEVRPESLRVSLVKNGEVSNFEPPVIPRARLDEHLARLPGSLPTERKGIQHVNLPKWEPTGAVGVFANHSQVSFRNVILTPIRTP